MSRLYLLASIVLVPCFSTFAAAQSAAPEPATTIHATSDMVIVDVTVTDKQQSAVHGLTADDFKIYEDGHLQTVKNFEEHRSPAAPPPITPMPRLEEGTYTNFTPAPATGPLTILLLDTLNTPTVDQITVRNQLLKFLKQAKPGTEIAIFVLGTRLRLIKGFTSDINELRTLMENSKPEVSPLIDTVASDNALGAREAAPDEKAQRAAARTRFTLDGFNQLERYLGSLQGRKNVIWFSGSFPLTIGGSGDALNPIPETMLLDEFKDTLTMMSRSQIAVYPVDAVGLRTDPMNDPENNGGFSTSESSSSSSDTINSSHGAFNGEVANAYGEMKNIAEVTGGKLYFNSNDLAGAIQNVIDSGANYYTITYVPTNSAQNGFYRKIKVETTRNGVSLAYRRGYYTYDRSSQKQASEAKASKDETGPEAAPYDALNAAMMRGAPAPTEIMLLISARPTTADSEPAAAPGNSVQPKVKGPFRRYTVRYNVAADNLSCPATPDGIHHCSLQILAFVYDSYRGLVNTQVDGVKLGIPPARYDAILAHGIELKQEISVPTQDGTYFLRTGVKDVNSGHVGALELPIAEAAKLTPVSATRP